MADVYLVTNSPHGPEDVLLVTAAVSASTEAANGGRARLPRQIDTTFARQYGFLNWRVHITGEGTLHSDGDLTFLTGLQATGCTTDLTLNLTGLMFGQVDIRCTTTNLHVAGHGSRTIRFAADLKHSTDPPELLDLLDLTEFTL